MRVNNANYLWFFYYHYDYHEWEDLQVVSTNLDKIEKYLQEVDLEEYPAITTDVDHENLAEKEARHYMIKPCKRI